jgi:hypothetical protein
MQTHTHQQLYHQHQGVNGISDLYSSSLLSLMVLHYSVLGSDPGSPWE